MIIIIPTRRSIDLSYLEPALSAGARVIVVDDSEGTINLTHPQVEVYNWGDKRRIAHRWLPAFPGLNGACMSFGLYLAWRDSEDDELILTLGDDCRLDLPDFVDQMERALSARTVPVAEGPGTYLNYVELMRDCPSNMFTRGIPYSARIDHQPFKIGPLANAHPAFNLGCLRGVQDINSIDKLRSPNAVISSEAMRADSVLVPKGKLISVSSGTMQFRRRLIPAAYQLPMHFEVAPDWMISRFGDIWGGFILKRLMDVVGDDMTFGVPWVHHIYPGDVEQNIWKEHVGIIVTETFLEMLDDSLTEVRPARYEDMMGDLVEGFARRAHTAPPLLRPYLGHLNTAWNCWLGCLRSV